jgi:tetratricopeptide (TPR) repeat protein
MNAELMAFQANAAVTGQPQDEVAARALIDKMKAEIVRIRDHYAPWQLLVGPMLTGQLGMLECQRLDFDAALPLLEAGSSSDGPSRVMLACIYYRRGRFDDMDKAFGEAVSASAKEPVPYALWAVLSVQHDRRDQALSALAQGLTALPNHKLLTLLRDQVANKSKVSVEVLGGSPDSVDVLIVDVKPENWATGGKLWTNPRS